MCGIVGLICNEYQKEHFDLFKELMKESEIRGKHASGFSFIKRGKIITLKSPKSSSEFLKPFSQVKSNIFLGHTRYSTSDLRFNQPLSEKNISIVHNGVITQSPKELWKKEFGYETKTNNDSELLLKNISKEGVKNIFEKFEDSSFSLGILKDNSLACLRNGKRPLWLFKFKKRNKIKLLIFCSTLDIFNRAIDKVKIPSQSYVYKSPIDVENARPGVFYAMRNEKDEIGIVKKELKSNIKDLQW